MRWDGAGGRVGRVRVESKWRDAESRKEQIKRMRNVAAADASTATLIYTQKEKRKKKKSDTIENFQI